LRLDVDVTVFTQPQYDFFAKLSIWVAAKYENEEW